MLCNAGEDVMHLDMIDMLLWHGLEHVVADIMLLLDPISMHAAKQVKTTESIICSKQTILYIAHC